MFGLSLRDRFDPDAESYITAVELADGQALEAEVKVAITRFVKGCKDDGIWTAIKASCILSGARTLAGALTPLVGIAPTNFNFVAGDYDRKTGLKGDGSTKYLDSNRNNSADPQNNKHLSFYCTQIDPRDDAGSGYVSSSVDQGGSFMRNQYIANTGRYNAVYAVNSLSVIVNNFYLDSPSFYGVSRNNPSSVTLYNGSATSVSLNSDLPLDSSIAIFSRGGGVLPSQGRLAFYSIGESLDLSKLDARVTALMSAFNRYIS